MRGNVAFCIAILIIVSIFCGCESGPASAPTSARPVAAAPSKPKPVKTASTVSTPGPAPKVKVTAPTTPAAVSPATAKADQAYLAGNYDEAFKLYQQAIRADRRDLDAHDGLSRCASTLHKYDAGARFYEELLRGDANNAALVYGAARMYLSGGDRQLSAQAAYRSIGIDQDLARSYFLVGLMLLTESEPKFASAQRAFQQCLERDPNYGPGWFQQARIAAGVNRDLPKARNDAMNALKCLRPVEREVRLECQVLLGALYVGEDRNEKALEVYRQALSEHGPCVYEKSDVGLLLERMGRTDEARKEWQKVMDHFGLADRTGVRAWRRLASLKKDTVDYSAFLRGGATVAEYRDLVSFLGERNPPKGVNVPEHVRPILDEFHTPVFCLSEDLDKDGKLETVVVDASIRQDTGRVSGPGQTPTRINRLWREASPVLYVCTNRGGLIGQHDSRLDQFHRVDLVDFDGDGIKEIVFAGFSGNNQLNLVVLAKRDKFRYQPTLVLPVDCADDAAGALLSDLDGDGKVELVTVGGECAWMTFYRMESGGAFVRCDREFPRFFRDFVSRHGKLSPEMLQDNPVMSEQLTAAREVLAASEATTTQEKSP